MKIALWSVGKTNEPYVQSGIAEFTKRLNHYYTAEWQFISTPKNASTLSENELKRKEGEAILGLLQKDDFLVALHEHGKQLTNEELAFMIQQRSNESTRRIVFLIGGAYGLSDDILKRANLQWSLSKLVFPHQLVRLILAEQLYRACTILRNEKYHHG
ncbi:MAG: 23S rRNA (pseudouridine(1915)-N(3))-methyltransferase RlmH [Chitinophagaceae bacterium]